MIWLGIGIGLVIGGGAVFLYILWQFAKGMNW